MSDRGKALEVIQKSGVLNPKMSLGEIMDVAGKLDALDTGALAAWTFISPHYVYTGDDKVDLMEQQR